MSLATNDPQGLTTLHYPSWAADPLQASLVGANEPPEGMGCNGHPTVESGESVFVVQTKTWKYCIEQHVIQILNDYWGTNILEL